MNVHPLHKNKNLKKKIDQAEIGLLVCSTLHFYAQEQFKANV